MTYRNRSVAGVLLLALVVGAFVAGYGYGRTRIVAGSDTDSQGYALLREVLAQIRSTYIARNVDTQQLFYGAAEGMVKALGDRYSRFLSPPSFKEYQADLSGVFFGVGIFVDLKDDRPVVVQPIPGTPAYRAGVRPGDRILTVNNVDTQGMSLEEVVARIRGPAGTQVTLRMARAGRTFVVPLVRARIVNVSIQRDENLPPEERQALREAHVAYIRILQFNETTAREFGRALDPALAGGARGLLIDLRNNGGGLLHIALEVANRFVPAGKPIVFTVDRNGRKTAEEATRGAKVTIPVVVLVNEFTASASEILAGALKDHELAVLVGLPTFGKGVVQSIVPLARGAAVTLTSMKYLTPGGHDIHGKGIGPHLVAGEKIEGRSEAEAMRIEAEQFTLALQTLRKRLAQQR